MSVSIPRRLDEHGTFAKPTTRGLTLPEHFYQQVKSDLIIKRGSFVGAGSPKITAATFHTDTSPFILIYLLSSFEKLYHWHIWP